MKFITVYEEKGLYNRKCHINTEHIVSVYASLAGSNDVVAKIKTSDGNTYRLTSDDSQIRDERELVGKTISMLESL